MFTLNSYLNALCKRSAESMEWDFHFTYEGEHYTDEVPVYTGDLWRLFGDNDKGHKKLYKLQRLAEGKAQIRFQDETISDDNGKVHERDSSTYFIGDCVVYSEEEIQDGTVIDEYMEFLIENNNRADQMGVDWTEHGFTKFEYDAESGFHPGQTDSPESVREMIVSLHGSEVETLFQIDSVGQFEIQFHAWYRLPVTEDKE